MVGLPFCSSGMARVQSIILIRFSHRRRSPMKRAGKPYEYGYLAAFLASDLAAYLTGATIPLDGGHSDFI